MPELENLKKKLKEKQDAWDKKKPDLIRQLKFYSDDMESYLGKIERGINATGDLEHSLNGMKEVFEEIEDTEDDIKRLTKDIEDEENWPERNKSANRVIQAFYLKNNPI